MTHGKSINIIFLIFIAFIVINLIISINQKKKLGKMLIEVGENKGNNRFILMGVLTVIVIYMISITVKDYRLAIDKVADGNRGIVIFNLISEIIFWASFYFALIYSQVSKRYIAEGGISLGTRAYKWNQVKEYGWKDSNLMLIVEERQLSKKNKREMVLAISPEKIVEVEGVLHKKLGKRERR
ncbi:MAG: DUF5673 domain-containing protein [Clostridium sp.]|nr:DUF5673 domain-containing protein [Clostridium sp.]